LAEVLFNLSLVANVQGTDESLKQLHDIISEDIVIGMFGL